MTPQSASPTFATATATTTVTPERETDGAVDDDDDDDDDCVLGREIGSTVVAAAPAAAAPTTTATAPAPSGDRPRLGSAESLPPPLPGSTSSSTKSLSDAALNGRTTTGFGGSSSASCVTAKKLAGMISREASMIVATTAEEEEEDIAKDGDLITAADDGEASAAVIMTSSSSSPHNNTVEQRLAGKLAEMRHFARAREGEGRRSSSCADFSEGGENIEDQNSGFVREREWQAIAEERGEEEDYIVGDDDSNSDSSDNSDSDSESDSEHEHEDEHGQDDDDGRPSLPPLPDDYDDESDVGSALSLVRRLEDGCSSVYGGGGGGASVMLGGGGGGAPSLAPLPIQNESDPLDDYSGEQSSYNDAPGGYYANDAANASANGSSGTNSREQRDYTSQLVALKLALANARSKIDEQSLLLRYARRDGARVVDAEREAHDLRDRNNEIGQELDRVRQQSKLDEADLAAVRADNEALTAENGALTVKVREMSSSQNRQRTVLEHALDDATHSATKRSDLMEKLASRVVDAAESKSQVLIVAKYLEDSRKLCGELSREKCALEGRLRQNVTVREQLQLSMREVMTERDGLAREVHGLNRSNVDLNRRLDAAEFRLEQQQTSGHKAGGFGVGLGLLWRDASACLGGTVGFVGAGSGGNTGAGCSTTAPRSSKRGRRGKPKRGGTERTVMAKVDEEHDNGAAGAEEDGASADFSAWDDNDDNDGGVDEDQSLLSDEDDTDRGSAARDTEDSYDSAKDDGVGTEEEEEAAMAPPPEKSDSSNHGSHGSQSFIVW